MPESIFGHFHYKYFVGKIYQHEFFSFRFYSYRWNSATRGYQPWPRLFDRNEKQLTLFQKSWSLDSLGCCPCHFDPCGLLHHRLRGFDCRGPFFYHLIQYLGAAYLIYIGVQSFWSKPMQIKTEGTTSANDLPPFQAFKNGFFTNALNPKASLFFLSVFSQVIEPSTPYFIQSLYGLEMSLIALIWFTVLAFILSHPYLRAKVSKVQKTFDRVLGCALIGLGLKIAFI